MTKKEIDRLFDEIRKKMEAGELPVLTDEQRVQLESINAINKSKQAWAKDFAKNGHRFGTVTETWEALRRIPEALHQQRYPDMETLNWLASAVLRCKENDPAQLLREMGLSVHGRHRTVNPDSVASRVNDLIKSGASIMAACEQASNEIGCSPHAAYRWHRKVYNVRTDARRR